MEVCPGRFRKGLIWTMQVGMWRFALDGVVKAFYLHDPGWHVEVCSGRFRKGLSARCRVAFLSPGCKAECPAHWPGRRTNSETSRGRSTRMPSTSAGDTPLKRCGDSPIVRPRQRAPCGAPSRRRGVVAVLSSSKRCRVACGGLLRTMS